MVLFVKLFSSCFNWLLSMFLCRKFEGPGSNTQILTYFSMLSIFSFYILTSYYCSCKLIFCTFTFFHSPPLGFFTLFYSTIVYFTSITMRKRRFLSKQFRRRKSKNWRIKVWTTLYEEGQGHHPHHQNSLF